MQPPSSMARKSGMWSASWVGDSVRSLSIAVWSVDGRRRAPVDCRLSTAWSTAVLLRPASTCNASAIFTSSTSW